MVIHFNASTAKDNEQFLSGEEALIARERSRRKKQRSKIAWVAGCVIGLALLACVGMVTVAVVFTLITGTENHDEWLALADEFMLAMADKEIDKAYGLLSKEMHREFTSSELAVFVDGPVYSLFDGYINLEIESYYINYNYPEGSTIELAGPVYYQENITGYFEFVLTEEGDGWKLLAFNVNVPPEKINSEIGQRKPNSSDINRTP